MGKVGIDDILAVHGPQILPRLINDAWRFDGHPCPRKVHLSEIEDAALGKKRLAIDLMVSAVGETYILPQAIELVCVPREMKDKKAKLRLVPRDGEATQQQDQPQSLEGAVCVHMARDGGRWSVEISNPEVLIDLTRVSKRTLELRLLELAVGVCPYALYVRTRSHQTVTTFLATPKARRVRSALVDGRLEVLDEAGKPFREKVLYFLGTLGSSSRYFRGVGVAIPSPKSQEATAFLRELTPIADDYETFTLSPEVVEGFRIFQAKPAGVWDTLLSIVRDITDHITNIYGEHRGLSLLGKLLVFHSVRQFRFDGEPLKRGWLEMLEVGDTGQGKTQQVDRIIEATALGEGVDGVSTTRTGLAYSFQKHNDSWFLVWGKYPLNDGKLLFIDEAQNLRPEDIDKIRKGRSDGVIAADGVRSGEHPTRTRLIATCNPKFQGVVDDQLFGIELVKQTFKDEDVRRFDFAIISSSSDDKSEINQPRVDTGRHKGRISPDVVADSIRWAWSRREEEVVFTDQAKLAVYEVARSLAGLYGEARDIPLMLDSDARHKIGRLAVATAALVHSTDNSHEQVVVTEEHVWAVRDFLTAVYNHPNCSFDLYAKIRRSEADLPDAEYEAIWAALKNCQVDSVVLEDGRERCIRLSEDDLGTLLRAFVTHGGKINRQDLAGELGKTAAWTSKIVRVLKTSRLIRVSLGRSGGYQATPKFIKFLKLAISRRDIES